MCAFKLEQQKLGTYDDAAVTDDVKSVYSKTNDATSPGDITAADFCTRDGTANGAAGYDTNTVATAADRTNAGARCNELVTKFHARLKERADDVKVLFHMPPTHLSFVYAPVSSS